MTVLIACNYLTSLIVVADSRVSYATDRTKEAPVDDNLQKIYQIHDRMILGFCGSLEAAHRVIIGINRNLETYSKPPIAVNLLSDVERWVQHEYQSIKNPVARQLELMLVTVEPKREKKSKWQTQDGIQIEKPGWFPYVPEFQVVVLTPSAKQDKLVRKRIDVCEIIGICGETRNILEEKLLKMASFDRKRPQNQAMVVAMTANVVLMEQGVDTIGGLFQCVLLNSDGIQWLGYGTREGVSLSFKNGGYVQTNHSTGRSVPVKHIVDWWSDWEKLKRKGAIGTFEDPGLREAVRKSQNRKSQE